MDRKKTGLDKLCVNNHYASLPESFYTRKLPKGLPDPTLVSVNRDVLSLLGLDWSVTKSDDFLQLCSGNCLPETFEPLAMKYAGHQFGQYNPDLGDGRGLLLAQVEDRDGQSWDLHLKGAGRTPYSRQGDGRAVLRSSIREYLCSAAMHGLGIPTTLALSLVVGSEPVAREKMEQGAMVLRVAQSHIRFGHFEHFYYTQQWSELKQLADYCIEQHFPALLQVTEPYVEFFRLVTKMTAELMAYWQSIGFVHGVMNTDNMSILGQTFDYGPYAFQDNFDPGYVCNHTDYSGRYAFNQQPQIGYWNLMALARALTPLIELEELNGILERYDDWFLAYYKKLMRAKLGLQTEQERDGALIKSLLQLLGDNQIDYSHFFRLLGQFDPAPTAENGFLRDLFIDRSAFDSWAQTYRKRLSLERGDNDTRKAQMDRVNPKYILRNYLAQQAIEDAEQGDFSLVNELLMVLQSPFDEQPDYDSYAKLPPEWGRKMVLSCSS